MVCECVLFALVVDCCYVRRADAGDREMESRSKEARNVQRNVSINIEGRRIIETFQIVTGEDLVAAFVFLQ